MLFYYKFLFMDFMLLQRELKYSHEVRILDRILKRSGSEKQSHCFFTNEILPFFFVTYLNQVRSLRLISSYGNS